MVNVLEISIFFAIIMPCSVGAVSGYLTWGTLRVFAAGRSNWCSNVVFERVCDGVTVAR